MTEEEREVKHFEGGEDLGIMGEYYLLSHFREGRSVRVSLMEIVGIIGRIILGLLIAISGLNHFTKMEEMMKFTKMRKIPLPGLAVTFTGLMLLFAGIAIIGWWQILIVPALIVLAIFLFFVSMMMHAFWKMPPERKTNEMHHFMGNMMLFGATLIIISLVV